MLKPARTIVALVITAMSAVALAAPAQADPVATAWVQFGSQPNPFTPGTSCTNPSNYVSTLSAFQTVVNNMASGGIIN
ncbi:MAG: hypothetical protein RIS43_253, partial [Actinomycetota bacterium]